MLQIKQAATAWAAAYFIIDINGYSAGSMTTVPQSEIVSILSRLCCNYSIIPIVKSFVGNFIAILEGAGMPMRILIPSPLVRKLTFVDVRSNKIT